MCRSARVKALAVLLASPFAWTGLLLAANNFGEQDRADAAKQMIVLAVQQGISSLPPTSSQSFSYEYDPQKDTYVRSLFLGPTVLRSPQTIGARHLSLRLAASYFELSDSFGPTNYLVNSPAAQGLQTKFGLDASAQVGLLNLAAGYGVANRFEIDANLPLVLVRAKASEVFVTSPNPNFPDIPIARLPDVLAANLHDGTLAYRKRTFAQLGADFPDGTHTGVGRISIGGKALAYAGQRLRVALAPEFFCPSPSQDALAGSDSAAILPSVIAGLSVADWFRVYVDAGYDYDFTYDELRSFVWTAGTSIASAQASVDFGLGGSEFNQGIKWTPSTASFPSGTLSALDRNRLGTSFIDFLFGIKMRVAEKTVLSGAVNTAVNNEGFRAAAIGTLALEVYL